MTSGKTKTIHQLIEFEDFVVLLADLKGINGRTLAEEIDPRTGGLPLHTATKLIGGYSESQPKDETIQNLEEVISLLVTLYPEGVTKFDRIGCLPIHHALGYDNSGCTVECIRVLVEPFPQTLVTAPTPASRRFPFTPKLPIHQLLSQQRLKKDVDRVIQYVVQHYPQCLQTPDADGNLPIHLVIDHCSLGTIKSLVEAYPKGLDQPDSKGNFPIHAAIVSSQPLDAITFLVESYPECLQKEDSNGQLPIHLASTYQLGGLKMIDYLLAKDPGTIKCRDNAGRLPLHCAVAFHQKKDRVVRYLVRKYPEGVGVQDKRGNLPCRLAFPHLLNDPVHIQSNVDMTTPGKNQLATGQQPSDEALEVELDDLKITFANEKAQLLKTHAEDQRRQENETKKEIEQLKKRHAFNLNLLAKARAKDKELMGKQNVKKIAQLEQAMDLHKDMVNEGRAFERWYMKQLLKEGNATPMEDLKFFAAKLQSQIKLVKGKLAPNADPSMMQLVFSSLVSHPNLSRSSMLECIKFLDVELTGLEADMQDMIPRGNGEAAAGRNASNPSAVVSDDCAAASESPERPAKRARPSPS